MVLCNSSLPLNGLRVLVVDSDSDSRDLLRMVFELYGVETIAAPSAGEALEILKQVKPDLLISEIRLPKEDGYSLMSKVKALEIAQQVQIPAIALTVYARESDRTYALSVGFERHLSKPFDIDELLEIVTCLTLNKQLQSIPA
jgi:CheY-like chemotaxis protein